MSYNLKEDLHDTGYTNPSSNQLPSKTRQVRDLTTCRDAVQIPYKRMRELNKQVQHTVGYNSPSLAQRQTNILFQQQASSRPIYEDNIVILEENSLDVCVFFNRCSRIEEHIQNELNKKRKANGFPPRCEQFFLRKIVKHTMTPCGNVNILEHPV